MTMIEVGCLVVALSPAGLMAAMAGLTRLDCCSMQRLWQVFHGVSCGALAAAVLSLALGAVGMPAVGILVRAAPLALVLAVLVQLLGLVIAAFSARYLEGEANQQRYLRALATVLASVHLLLLADHWLLLIAAWAAVGMALERLLCFYPDRPFALLAAHKKRIADRLADLLLLSAAGLAWWAVGSGVAVGPLGAPGAARPVHAAVGQCAFAGRRRHAAHGFTAGAWLADPGDGGAHARVRAAPCGVWSIWGASC